MSKSKKKKQTPKKFKGHPPLSKADKFLYSALEVVGALLIIVPLVAFDPIAGFFIFKNPDVLSFETRWTLLLLFPFAFVYLIHISDSLYKKIPIFGNQKVDYYDTLNHKFVLPLFDNRYKNIERFKEYQRKRLKRIGIWCCVITFLLCVGILGCVGRHEFSREGITTYSIFNNAIDKHSYEEVKNYEVSAIDSYRYTNRGGYYESDIYLTVYLKNGGSYCASYTAARDIYALEEIAELLKSKEKAINARDLQNFISRHSFSENELKAIYRLFDM